MTKRVRRSQLLANRIWLSIFGVWLVLLSGALAGVLGSPGIIQAVKLNSLLSGKLSTVDGLESDVEKMQTEASALATNRAAQQREIRKTLGYAAKDEIIFEFSGDASSETSSPQTSQSSSF